MIVGSLLAISSTALASCGGTAIVNLPGALANKSASQILAISQAAFVKDARVHAEQVATLNAQTQTQVDDIGPGEGHQTLTLSTGARGEVMLVKGTIYFNENARLLTDQFGKAPARVVNHWISVPSSSPVFKPFASGLSISSLASQVYPSGSLKIDGLTTFAGQRTLAVSGSFSPSAGAKGSLTVYVSLSLPFRLVGESARATSNGVTGKFRGLFTAWGVHFTVTAPTGAIPISGAHLLK